MTNLIELYATLGESIAAILEHPDTPIPVYNALTQFTHEVDNAANGYAYNNKRDAVHATGIFVFSLAELGLSEAAQPPPTETAQHREPSAKESGLVRKARRSQSKRGRRSARP